MGGRRSSEQPCSVDEGAQQARMTLVLHEQPYASRRLDEVLPMPSHSHLYEAQAHHAQSEGGMLKPSGVAMISRVILLVQVSAVPRGAEQSGQQPLLGAGVEVALEAVSQPGLWLTVDRQVLLLVSIPVNRYACEGQGHSLNLGLPRMPQHIGASDFRVCA